MRMTQHALFRLSVVALIILGASLALAQDNTENAWQNDTSNWCDVGNMWGDGRCNTADEARTNWMYEAGWWFQRVTEGDITPCQLPAYLAASSGCGGTSTGEVTVIINTPSGPVVFVFYLTGTGAQIGATCDASCQATGIAIAGNSFYYETYAPANSLPNDTTTRIVVHGNDNVNAIIGSYGDDILYGNGGDDDIYGDSSRGAINSGNDTIYGGDGNDRIFGDSALGATNSGNDTIDGGDGNDFIYGDSLEGATNSGNDTIDGGDGNDFIYGDSLEGATNSGNDTLDGGDGNDYIYGDSFRGATNSGNDTLDGGDGNDYIYGDSFRGATNSGNDSIESGSGNDNVYGDSVLGTNSGTNTCTNAGGTDTSTDCN